MSIGLSLSGQRALVTASSRGIGYAVAEGFLTEGAKVVVNSSNEENLTAAVGRLRKLGEVHGIVGNLKIQKEIDRLVTESEEFMGGIDAFVYVTGTPHSGNFMEQGYEDWSDAAALLTVSPSYLAKRVAEIMIRDKTRGKMVFSASYAIREPIPNIALSNVCRIAIAGLVRTLARELGPQGIRVNGVLPGYIETGRLTGIIQDSAKRKGISKEEALANIVKEIPMGRVGSTKELAQVILFLASDLSSYVSGAMVPVDGAILRSIG